MKQWMAGILGCTALFCLSVPTQAEPPIHLSPGDILGGLLGGTVGSVSPSYAPTRVLAECSHEIEECWKARGLNKDNQNQVYDACWKGVKKCPKVCKDAYFSRRKAGANGPRADDMVLFGRPSCVPGLDKQTHPNSKLKVNDSAVQVSVTVGGRAIGADVRVVPVDDQGHEMQQATGTRNSDPPKGISMQHPSGSLLLYLPVGKYHLHVRSPDRFYHPERAFSERVELLTLQPGKKLVKAYVFGLGRLVAKAQTDDGKPLDARLNLKRLDGTGRRVFSYKSLPLDVKLLSGKYRMVVMRRGGAGKKAFNIEVKDGKLTSKTMTFTSGAM